MGFVNQILCLIQGIIDQILGVIGGFLGAEIIPPDLGCVAEEEAPM